MVGYKHAIISYNAAQSLSTFRPSSSLWKKRAIGVEHKLSMLPEKI